MNVTWKRDATYQAAFQRKDGWLGADGAYSLPLDARKTLWLFSDTIEGHCQQDVCQLNGEMAHNSLALETPDGFEFQATQSFTPPDRRGWFWVSDGVAEPGHAEVFLGQFEAVPNGPDGFNFRFLDSWIADVATGEHVSDVKVRSYHRLSEFMPRLETPDGAAQHFGAALCRDDHYQYVYGTQDFGFSKRLVVARIPVQTDLLESAGQWELFQDGAWTGTGSRPGPVTADTGAPLEVSNELSVFRRDGQFFMVTQVGQEVRLLCSERPEGPFQPAAPPQRIEESHPGIFTYNAKGHEQEIDQRGLLVSYNRNVLPFSELAAHPDLYQPQFFRLPLPKGK